MKKATHDRKKSELSIHFSLGLFSKSSLETKHTFLSNYNGNTLISPQIRYALSSISFIYLSFHYIIIV